MDSSITVLGVDLVENARKLVLLGEAKEAFLLMRKIVHDKEAYSILRGYKTLTGNNVEGYKVVDEESDTYFENLLNSYAGKCYMKGHYFEPYGLTPEVEEEDIPLWILGRCKGKQIREVIQSYALSMWGDNPMEDVAIHVRNTEMYNSIGGDGASGWVLFRRTSPSPFWTQRCTKPLEAIQEFVEAFGPIAQLSIKNSNVVPFLPKQEPKVLPPIKGYQSSYKSTYVPPKKLTEEEIQELREKILEASQDFYEIEAGGETYRIPKAPFQQWALDARPEKALPWTPISPKNTHQWQSVCPFRSDWMIGAGIPLEDFYKSTSDVMIEVNKLAEGLREEHLEAPAVVFGSISSYGASGKVIDPTNGKDYGLYVVEEASADYLLLALSGSAIIAERPGNLIKMASMENSGIVVAVVPGAREKFPIGSNVQIDGKKGAVRFTKGYSSYYSKGYSSHWDTW